MKQILFSIIAIAFAISNAFAQNNSAATPVEKPTPLTAAISNVSYYCNPPLPYKPAKLDILFIGNSFSLDTSAALPEIFNSLGIKNVNVYCLYKGGCSLKQHYDLFKNGKKEYELYQYNYLGEKLLEKKIGIREVMRRNPYDIVVFQQYSQESGDYATYEPYLAKLMQAYAITNLSPRTTFAFNMTWAWSSKHKNISKYKTPLNMYNSIVNATKRMKQNTGIDVIIPCGTAVQNARSVSVLKTQNEFTRDNQHIDMYMGRYLLACTFFESIVAPCMERDLREDITIMGKEGQLGVNNDTRSILQNCARLAVANNFEVSEFAGQ